MELIVGNPNYHDSIDAVEAEMYQIGAHEFEMEDFFCGGMYVRTIYIPEGSYLTSKIHRFEHTYFIASGSITIFTEDGGEETLEAPYLGITLAGTRRFAKANTNVIWTTTHRVEGKTREEVEKEIIIDRINPLLLNLKKQEELICRG